MTTHDDHESGQRPSEGSFDLGPDGGYDYLEFISQFPLKKQICMCGHSVNSHHYSTYSRTYVCRTGTVWCRCQYPKPALAASNAFDFKRSTRGVGVKHALGLGVAALLKRGGSATWLVDLVCAVTDCNAVDVKIVCLDKDSHAVPHSEVHSVFLCREHLIQFGADLF